MLNGITINHIILSRFIVCPPLLLRLWISEHVLVIGTHYLRGVGLRWFHWRWSVQNHDDEWCLTHCCYLFHPPVSQNVFAWADLFTLSILFSGDATQCRGGHWQIENKRKRKRSEREEISCWWTLQLENSFLSNWIADQQSVWFWATKFQNNEQRYIAYFLTRKWSCLIGLNLRISHFLQKNQNISLL